MEEHDIKNYAKEVIRKLSESGDSNTLDRFLKELNKFANLSQYNKLIPPEGIMITSRKEYNKLKQSRLEMSEFRPEKMAEKLSLMTRNQKVKFLNKLSNLIFGEQAVGFRKLDEFVKDENLNDNSKVLLQELHYRMNENQGGCDL